jgi:hypothetical protein
MKLAMPFDDEFAKNIEGGSDRRSSVRVSFVRLMSDGAPTVKYLRQVAPLEDRQLSFVVC